MASKLLLIYLSLFPLGQLPKLLLGFHLTDLVMIFSLLFLPKKKSVFCQIALFGYIVSSFIWGINFTGVLYLIRFYAYINFFINLAEEKLSPKTLIDSLVAVGSTISILGILQYLIMPDLRSLIFLGWDDHYFRLVSMLFDPAFTGIIIALTLVLIIYRISQKQSAINITLLIINLASLVLTFSRSSYAAFFISLIYIFRRRINKKFIFISFLFVFLVFVAPKPGGEGVNLLRVSSAILKLQNFEQGLAIVSHSPLFGIGFNNICAFQGNTSSHACSGLDNSFLFVLATTGVLGLLSLCDLIYKLFISTGKSMSGDIFRISLIMVLLHSLFTNTLFYPSVIGWLGVLFSISRSKEYSLGK